MSTGMSPPTGGTTDMLYSTQRSLTLPCRQRGPRSVDGSCTLCPRLVAARRGKFRRIPDRERLNRPRPRGSRGRVVDRERLCRARRRSSDEQEVDPLRRAAGDGQGERPFGAIQVGAKRRDRLLRAIVGRPHRRPARALQGSGPEDGVRVARRRNGNRWVLRAVPPGDVFYRERAAPAREPEAAARGVVVDHDVPGALSGAAIGILVPHLHRHKQETLPIWIGLAPAPAALSLEVHGGF
jgi:hypothetical protein